MVPAIPYLPSELVTLRYENCDIRDLLSIWAKQLNMSYTVATDVQGVVSIDAKSALAFQTLSQLLAPLGATFTIEGGIVNIFKQAGVLPDLEQVVPLFRVTGETRFSALCRLTRIGNFSIEAEPGVSLGRAIRVDARGASVRMLLKQILGPDLAAEARKGYVSILQSNRAPQGGG